MELGNFSVSLAVKDIEASKLFYEKLGFTVFMGDQSQFVRALVMGSKPSLANEPGAWQPQRPNSWPSSAFHYASMV